jgi:hypothetical protein
MGGDAERTSVAVLDSAPRGARRLRTRSGQIPGLPGCRFTSVMTRPAADFAWLCGHCSAGDLLDRDRRLERYRVKEVGQADTAVQSGLIVLLGQGVRKEHALCVPRTLRGPFR